MKSLIKNLIYLMVLSMSFVLFSCKDKPEDPELPLTVQNLTAPTAGFTVVLTDNGSPLLFQWEASKRTGATYEVIFDKVTGNFSSLLHKVSSDDNGTQPTITFTHAQLDQIAAQAGTKAGETVTLKWTVIASKESETAMCEKSHTLGVTRLEKPIIVESDQLFVTGDASEGGNDLSQAIKMRVLDKGKYEVFTELRAGQDYYFVDAITGTPNRFSIAGGEVKAGGTSMAGESGVYKIVLNLNDMTASLVKINAVRWHHCNSNSKTLEIPYVGRGVWALHNHTMTSGDFSSGDNQNPRYRFFMEYEGGAESVWGPVNHLEDGTPNSPTAPTAPADYFNAREYTWAEVKQLFPAETPQIQSQFNPKWKRTQSNTVRWLDFIYDFSLILQADGSYRHTLIEKDQPGEFVVPYSVNWTAAADSSSKAFVANLWWEQRNYFRQNNFGGTGFEYWPQAHALDVLVDAYLRTGDDFYKSYFDKWFTGVRAGNGNKWKNNYYDDMEWIALALLRAYKATNDIRYKDAVLELWGYIKVGWTDTHAGGGIAWQTAEMWKKNACSNGPACILAARLYQEFGNEDDKNWAVKIYEWEKGTLLRTSDNAILDHIDGRDNTLTTWTFTYNQGSFIGSAVELYKIFGAQNYLNDAKAVANFTTNSLASNSILKLEGTGDSGGGNDAHLFKGIFIRYFTELILVLDGADKERYIQFLKRNAEVLWTKGTDKNLWFSLVLTGLSSRQIRKPL